MPAAPVLEVRDLRVEYVTTRGAVAAVDGVDLDVHEGEFVGITSNTITYGGRSPRTRADSRKSRLRSDSVCARSWLAPYDQPVTTSTTRTTGSVPFPAYVARMMISGNVGMTRNTLVTIDSTSSGIPPRYAAETPAITDSMVAKNPAATAITSDCRVP